jgi:hypothetical protein
LATKDARVHYAIHKQQTDNQPHPATKTPSHPQEQPGRYDERPVPHKKTPPTATTTPDTGAAGAGRPFPQDPTVCPARPPTPTTTFLNPHPPTPPQGDRGEPAPSTRPTAS